MRIQSPRTMCALIVAVEGRAFNGRRFDGEGRRFDGEGRGFGGDGRRFDGDGRRFDGDGRRFDGPRSVPAERTYSAQVRWF